MRALRTLLFVAVAGAAVFAQGNAALYFQNQIQNYWRALNDPTTNARVQQIWLDLVSYSGTMRPVIPAQQFNAGQSLPNGIVLLDLSIAGDPDENVTAFWLAHEYGHQVLGHPQLGATPWGQYIAMRAGTTNEDAADRWAARFMRAKGYDVEPALDFLCTVPSAPGDSHSTGPRRAANVARAFGGGATASCDEPDPDFDRADPRPRPASACITPAGSCPMVVPTPVGSSCYCATGYGPIGGIAR
jgi:hypothetical protein